MKQFIHATAILVGMIIGVGIFAVPYVSAQAGFAGGAFWIMLLGLLSLLIHLYFGEVVAGTPGQHRLPGYAARYLGHSGKQLILSVQTVAFWGAQVAYLLVGGTFLRIITVYFNEVDPFFFSLVVFAFIALITWLGMHVFERVEFWMTGALVFILVVILALGAPHVELANLRGVSWPDFFGPYGVVLFALGGSAAIPTMWEIVGHSKRWLRKSIIAGTGVAVLVTLLFAVVMVGMQGLATTPDAITGLGSRLGADVVWIGALFGFFAVLTSYLMMALYLKELFMYDFRVKRLPAWLFAVWVPLLLAGAGTRNFVQVLDLVGSVFSGFDAIMILLTALAFFKRRHTTHRTVKTVLGILGILLLTLGIAQKLL